MSVCCKCCVLSNIGLCDEPILRPEKPYGLSVWVCVCVGVGVRVYVGVCVCVWMCVCVGCACFITCNSTSLHLQLSRWKRSVQEIRKRLAKYVYNVLSPAGSTDTRDSERNGDK
jgi:hypothetical protein